MLLFCSRTIFTILRLATPAIITAFILLAPPATPGFASIDTRSEIIHEIIDPCFLTAVHKEKRKHPRLYRNQNDDDLLAMIKLLSPDDDQALASEFEALFGASNLQGMTRQERLQLYNFARRMCISSLEN